MVIIERWRRFYNRERPHSSLGYRRPHQRRSSPSNGWSLKHGEWYNQVGQVTFTLVTTVRTACATLQ
jgi:transposase InsO family protein